MTILISLLLSLVPLYYSSEVCMVGYLMDIYCIDRGTLLDKPTLDTLRYPNRHSIHCLVDVGQCRSSGFELLKDPDEGDDIYCRAYTLDNAGNDMVIDHAREIGNCGTCDSGGGQSNGYRATIRGEVVGSGKVPLLAVTNVTAEDDGCPGGATEPDPDSLDCTAGSLSACTYAHGSMMMVSWGILLPAGVISARLLKHRPDSLWFTYHIRFQMLGLFLATIAWIVAIFCFDVFTPGPGDGNSIPFSHGILGMVVMSFGVLQPLNACLRPHPPKGDTPKPLKRYIWECIHKFSGYAAIGLAVVTIALGTTLPAKREAQIAFQVLYGCILVCIAAVIVLLRMDSQNFDRRSKIPQNDNENNHELNSISGKREVYHEVERSAQAVL